MNLENKINNAAKFKERTAKNMDELKYERITRFTYEFTTKKSTVFMHIIYIYIYIQTNIYYKDKMRPS